MAARKRAGDDAAAPVPKRRSSRQAAAAATAKSSPVSAPEAHKKTEKTDEQVKGRKTSTPVSRADAGRDSKPKPSAQAKTPSKPASSAAKASKKKDATPNGVSSADAGNVSDDPDVDDIPTTNPDAPRHDGTWYWLMKAEPDSRFENGIDVRFSIDDLRAKTEPEGWDGIRAYPARNHMRNMNAGDKAFFYHSNCKEPGIAGTMEVIKEFSEDKSARRRGTPYYDPSSTKDKPRWSLVHVSFRKKFAVPITLKELRELGKPGGPLEAMQMLKQSRLSVSRVSEGEWKALCEVADRKAREQGLEHEV